MIRIIHLNVLQWMQTIRVKGVLSRCSLALGIVVAIIFSTPKSVDAALSYIGSAEASGNSANYDVDLSGLSLVAGDLLVVATGFPSVGDGNPGVSTSGYTEVAEIWANAALVDSNLSLNWKLMGGTPDSVVTCLGSGNSALGSVCEVHAWRGADQATPMDVSVATSSGISSTVPDGPSITPVTSGAVVITAGFSSTDSADNAVTAPSGYSNQADISVDPGYAATVGLASKAWVSGAEDPAAWTNWVSSTNYSWAAATLAIRPAAETGASETPTNLITTSTTGGVSLSWTAPSDPGSSNLETYGIWRATSPFSATSSATLIASIATTSTSYSDTSATLRTYYYYGVTATNGDATSSLSNIRSSVVNNGRIIRMRGLRLR